VPDAVLGRPELPPAGRLLAARSAALAADPTTRSATDLQPTSGGMHPSWRGAGRAHMPQSGRVL